MLGAVGLGGLLAQLEATTATPLGELHAGGLVGWGLAGAGLVFFGADGLRILGQVHEGLLGGRVALGGRELVRGGVLLGALVLPWASSLPEDTPHPHERRTDCRAARRARSAWRRAWVDQRVDAPVDAETWLACAEEPGPGCWREVCGAAGVWVDVAAAASTGQPLRLAVVGAFAWAEVGLEQPQPGEPAAQCAHRVPAVLHVGEPAAAQEQHGDPGPATLPLGFWEWLLQDLLSEAAPAALLVETGHDASWARPGEADPGREARQGNNELAVQRAATALESLRLLLGVLAEQRAEGPWLGEHPDALPLRARARVGAVGDGSAPSRLLERDGEAAVHDWDRRVELFLHEPEPMALPDRCRHRARRARSRSER